MGNSFRAHFAYFAISLLLGGVCFLMVACEVDRPDVPELLSIQGLSPPAQEETAPEIDPDAVGGQPARPGNMPETDPQHMSVEIHCEDVRRDACGLLVTLHAVRDDVELDILLFGDNGVRFLPNMDVIPKDYLSSQDGKRSLIDRVKLLRGESRQVYFPYLPSDLDLPGAYQIIVLATEANTNDLFGYRRTPAYIIFNEIGEFHLLPSENEFNGNFRNLFTEGLLDVGYWIQFEEAERPSGGNLWVRVDSPVDEYEPIIKIISSGAVTFLDDGLWKPDVSNAGMVASRNFPKMNTGGSRVTVFPFEIDRNGRLLDGEYAFLVEQTASGLAKTETMPVVVQLFSDPQYPTERWLGAHAIPPIVATPTPNATAVAANENNILIKQVGFGGIYKGLDEQTANEVCKSLADAKFDAKLPRPKWTRYIANFNGTLCQAYLEFVAGSVPISWTNFHQRMVVENDNLDTQFDRLDDHRVYILPEIDQ